MKATAIFETIENSPLFPKIPQELCVIINMIQDPIRTDIDKMVERIKNIENLEAMVLNFINSAYFDAPKKVESLKEAIVFLGMTTMQVIIIAQIVSYLFPKDQPEFSHFHKWDYLKHSIGTAIASIAIAEWLGEGDKYELFAYGVLHDIGVVLYELCLPETMEKVEEQIIKGNHPVLAERIVLGGVDHTDIGAWFCKKYNFPWNITDVVASHHWPRKSKNRTRIMDIISLGDYISHIFYREFLIKHRLEKPPKMFKVPNSLGIPIEVLRDIRFSLDEEVEKTLKIINRF